MSPGVQPRAHGRAHAAAPSSPATRRFGAVGSSARLRLSALLSFYLHVFIFFRSGSLVFRPFRWLGGNAIFFFVLHQLYRNILRYVYAGEFEVC